MRYVVQKLKMSKDGNREWYAIAEFGKSDDANLFCECKASRMKRGCLRISNGVGHIVRQYPAEGE